jgi:hypothetical protein
VGLGVQLSLPTSVVHDGIMTESRELLLRSIPLPAYLGSHGQNLLLPPFRLSRPSPSYNNKRGHQYTGSVEERDRVCASPAEDIRRLRIGRPTGSSGVASISGARRRTTER